MESGNIYHLISRFVAKEWFIESSAERRMYISLLGTAIAETNWRLFTYAVMSSHIHLGLVAGTTTLASWLRPLHTVFANWMNVRRERIGAVFVRGPNIIDVLPEGVAQLIRYVHCNPVRAGVVGHPAESDWTTHGAYVGTTARPSWLDVESGLALGGFASRAAFALWIDGAEDASPSVASTLSPKRGRGRPRHAVAEVAAIR